MEPQIPPQVKEYSLTRLCCLGECQSHNGDCSCGKRPVVSVEEADPINRIKSWINEGGNYGVVARSNDDLVIFDSDSAEFSDLLKTGLPLAYTFEAKKVTYLGNDGGDGE